MTIAGQDVVTRVMDIRLLPEGPPIYLMTMSNDPVIYRLSGAVERISRIVALNGERSGFTGIAADKVTYPQDASCKASYRAFRRGGEGWAQPVADMVSTLTGRPVTEAGAESAIGLVRADDLHDLTIGGTGKQRDATQADQITQYGPLVVTHQPFVNPRKPYVPGQHQQIPPANRAAERYFPAGMVSLLASEVVSQSPAEPYETLPNAFGLVQLVEQGKLRAIDPAYQKAYITAWREAHSAPYRHRLDRRYLVPEPRIYGDLYVIQGDMRFPPGGSRGPNTHYILPEGVNYPSGKPVDSDILVMTPDEIDPVSGKRIGNYRPGQVDPLRRRGHKTAAEMEAGFTDDPVCRMLPMQDSERIVGLTIGPGRKGEDDAYDPVEIVFGAKGMSQLVLHADAARTGKVIVKTINGALLHNILVLSDGYIDVSAPGLPDSAIVQKHVRPQPAASVDTAQNHRRSRRSANPCPLENASSVATGGSPVIGLDYAVFRATGARLDMWRGLMVNRVHPSRPLVLVIQDKS